MIFNGQKPGLRAFRGSVLASFRVTRAGCTGDQMKYEYTCAEVTTAMIATGSDSTAQSLTFRIKVKLGLSRVVLEYHMEMNLIRSWSPVFVLSNCGQGAPMTR